MDEYIEDEAYASEMDEYPEDEMPAAEMEELPDDEPVDSETEEFPSYSFQSNYSQMIEAIASDSRNSLPNDEEDK
jgi:hypothetical protein